MTRPLLTVLLSLLGCWGCAHGTWSPRTIPACHLPSGDAQLARERSYYAALIAASERKYLIVHAEAANQLEVEYRSPYKPEQGIARWRIDVAPHASLSVHYVPPGTRLSRKHRKRVEHWFDLLSDSTRRLSCRDLNWLRWEAQNRGLAPMIEGGSDVSGAPLSTAGAEALGPAGPLVDPNAPGERERQARRLALEREREEITLVAPIALLASGAGLLGVGVGLLNFALLNVTADCESSSTFGGEEVTSCTDGGLRRNLLIGAGAAGAAAIALLASGAPLLAKRLRRKRDLGRELRVLAAPQLGLGPATRGLSLSFSARF